MNSFCFIFINYLNLSCLNKTAIMFVGVCFREGGLHGLKEKLSKLVMLFEVSC